MARAGLLSALLIGAAIAAPGNAHAGLLGFEVADGYKIVSAPVAPNSVGPGVLNRVWEYDAGRTGGPIAANSGLWQNLTADATGRNRAVAIGYNPASSPNNVTYTIAHPDQPGAGLPTHSGAGHLVLRHGPANANPDGTNPYGTRYHLESVDLGGVNPTAVNNNALVQWSIHTCARGGPPLTAYGDGANSDFDFFWAFMDSDGKEFLNLGWNNALGYVYRTDPNGAFQAVPGGVGLAPDHHYDLTTFNFDFLNDTFSFTTPDGTSGNIALGMDARNLAVIDWVLDTDQNKVSFDDSGFQVTFLVPEPTSLALFGLGLGAFTLIAKRQRRKVTV